MTLSPAPNPSTIVAPFTIVVDTREQRPFTFTTIAPDVSQRRTKAQKAVQFLTVPTIRRAITAGDYSIVGHDGAETCNNLKSFSFSPRGIAIERKSLHDLYNTLGQSRARFTRELDRLQTFDFAAVICEASWTSVLRGVDFDNVSDSDSTCELVHVRSNLNSKTIFRSVIAWQQRYPNIHWWMCPGRKFAEVATYRLLERFWNERRRELEQQKEKAAV